MAGDDIRQARQDRRPATEPLVDLTTALAASWAPMLQRLYAHRPRAAARARMIAAIAGCVLAAVACSGSPAASAPADARDTRFPAAAASAEHEARGLATPRRKLTRDEGRGGHTLARHVGRSPADLADRLRRERNIPAASTWSDRDTAERIVGATLTRSRPALDRWIARRGGRPNLALEWEGAGPIGLSLRRGARRPDAVSCATIVLRWSEPDHDFYVLTSYPEACR